MAATDRSETRTHKVTRSLAKKALAPLAASAAAYAAKKLPQLFQEKIAPRLRERGGAGATVQDAAQRVGEQVQQAKDRVVGNVGESRVASAGGGGQRGQSGGARRSNGQPDDAEREDARRKRAQNRQARRKAST